MTTTQHESIAQNPAPSRHVASSWLLSFILAGGPVAWLGQLIVTFTLATHACHPYVSPERLPMTRWLPPVLAVIIGSALMVSLAALMAAWRLWGKTRNEARGGGVHALTFGEGRTRFMALVGLIVNSLFAVACLFAVAAYCLVPLCN